MSALQELARLFLLLLPFRIARPAELITPRINDFQQPILHPVSPSQVSKSHLRILNSAESGVRVSDLGSKHGAVITKPAPNSASAPQAQRVTKTKVAAAAVGSGGGRHWRPAGIGGKDPPARADAIAPASVPVPAMAKKFFPIPIPREPEWVAGAHGDRISLGKTVMVLEREGGPEPPNQGHRPSSSAAAASTRPARSKQSPAVISKGFAANPNLVCMCVYILRVFVCGSGGGRKALGAIRI